jgi:hypothetical protein
MPLDHAKLHAELTRVWRLPGIKALGTWKRKLPTLTVVTVPNRSSTGGWAESHTHRIHLRIGDKASEADALEILYHELTHLLYESPTFAHSTRRSHHDRGYWKTLAYVIDQALDNHTTSQFYEDWFDQGRRASYDIDDEYAFCVEMALKERASQT